MTPKLAELTTELKPYQQRVRDRMREQDGLVVAHGMGTGKTLTSMAVMADQAPGSRIKAIVPAALRDNYPKEIAKHTDNGELAPGVSAETESHNKFTRDGQPTHLDLMVVDEAHRARSIGSKLKDQIRRAPADKRLLMTGTAAYNHPADISPLVNLAAGKHVLPETPGEFERRYVRDEKVYPRGVSGLMYRMTGGEPGYRQKLVPDRHLRESVRKYVDYNPTNANDPNFPRLRNEEVRVGLSERQEDAYNFAMGELPPALRRKVQNDMPANKQEAAKLIAFLNGPRQIVTSTGGHGALNPLDAARDSPKIQDLLKHIESDPARRRVVYSNYIGAAVDPIAAALDEKKIRYGRFTGQEKKTDREQYIRDYNEGRLNTLLISSAGGEGLDLKGTREVNIMEPHWNEPKLDQVMARARRFGSHAHLPEAEREVLVRRYLTETRDRTVANRARHLFGAKEKMSPTAEQYIHNRSLDKQQLSDQMLNVMQEEQNATNREYALRKHGAESSLHTAAHYAGSEYVSNGQNRPSVLRTAPNTVGAAETTGDLMRDPDDSLLSRVLGPGKGKLKTRPGKLSKHADVSDIDYDGQLDEVMGMKHLTPHQRAKKMFDIAGHRENAYADARAARRASLDAQRAALDAGDLPEYARLSGRTDEYDKIQAQKKAIDDLQAQKPFEPKMRVIPDHLKDHPMYAGSNYDMSDDATREWVMDEYTKDVKPAPPVSPRLVTGPIGSVDELDNIMMHPGPVKFTSPPRVSPVEHIDDFDLPRDMPSPPRSAGRFPISATLAGGALLGLGGYGAYRAYRHFNDRAPRTGLNKHATALANESITQGIQPVRETKKKKRERIQTMLQSPASSIFGALTGMGIGRQLHSGLQNDVTLARELEAQAAHSHAPTPAALPKRPIARRAMLNGSRQAAAAAAHVPLKMMSWPFALGGALAAGGATEYVRRKKNRELLEEEGLLSR